MDWANEYVSVTGGAGFIGSHLVERLVQGGARNIEVFDNLSRGKTNNLSRVTGRVRLLTQDLKKSVPLFEPGSIVFHLASKVTGIQYNVVHNWDMFRANERIYLNVCEAVARARPRLFVFVSTACVYPHNAPVPTPESWGDVGDPEPTNHGYGVAKWTGEQMAKYVSREFSVPTLIVRFFNAFGPRDYYDPETSHVAPSLIHRVLSGDNPVVVWGTGKQTRALVDARDIARALVLLAENAGSGCDIVNIGHERECSIEDLASTIIRLSGKQARLEFDTSKPNGYERRAADTTRLRELIGWVPDTPLEVTLQDMITDYQERYQ